MTTSSSPAPDAVYVWANPDDDVVAASRDSTGTWSTSTADVLITETKAGLAIRAASPAAGLSRIALTWSHGVAEGALVLGDAWERSYGDLGWQPIRPERILPWYWLATCAGRETRGAGVRVRPGALASWTVDSTGVTLWLDVRSGAHPVMLGGRVLDVATVVSLVASPDTSAYAAHRELCSALCSDPMPTEGPIVGCNNWYYAYGMNFDADAVIRDAAMISAASDGHPVRPFCVIDAGWSSGSGGAPGGPWTKGSGSFADMAKVASQIRDEGARPGLWLRPLLSSERSDLTRGVKLDGEWPLDPSRGEVIDQVRADIERLTGWGYELIKHDFSTFDTIGHFVPGTEFGMGAVPWRFADATRTTAEVIVDLYREISDAAGAAVVIGCNTIGHLAAGLVQVQRTGDDTSGRHWERTRRMGVNTLAFRQAQHGTFFTLDSDCVPSTPQTPWDKNAQFLELVAASGTALFVSIDPTTHDARVDADLRRAVKIALDGGAPGGVEPLDWQHTSAPRRWRVGHDNRTYSWNVPLGVDLSFTPI